ncbi:hypothetical protein [Botrimarina sp.]|uniref:hypothetical protein n=1 Tax=Botrimarina sp. TaxID=2795802 RepID=UPI0032EB2288
MLDTTIRFACDGCGKRYRVPAKHAGRQTPCPGCGAAMVVPAAAPPPAEDDQYTLEEAAPVASVHAVAYEEYAARRPAGYRSVDDAPDTSRRDRQSRPADAPRYGLGFLKGFGEFFFNPAMASAWLGLGVGFPLVLMLPMALGQFIGIFSLLATGVFLGLILVALPIWLGVSSCIYLTIIGDAAGGARRVVEWPGLDAGAWIAATLQLLLAGVMSILPGVAVASAIGHTDSATGGAILLASLWLCLPVVLLSQLDGGAWWSVLSDGPLRTMWHAPVTWAVFYLFTALLIGGWGYASSLATRLPEAAALLISMSGEVALTLVWAWLLGRLAWTAGAATPEVSFGD